MTSEAKEASIRRMARRLEERFGGALSLMQAATVVSLHERTVRRLAQIKRFPAVKVGGVWRVRPQALAEWWVEQEAANTAGFAATTR